MVDLEALKNAVIKGDQNTAVEITKQALEEGTGPGKILDEGLIKIR